MLYCRTGDQSGSKWSSAWGGKKDLKQDQKKTREGMAEHRDAESRNWGTKRGIWEGKREKWEHIN